MKIGITMIVSDRPVELEHAIKSAEGMYDYLSICLVKYNNMSKRKLTKYGKCKSIAKQYNAIISEYQVREKWKFNFIDDFSTPRNMAITVLPKDTDWVFVLDSDDEMQEPKVVRMLIEKLEHPSMILVSIGAEINRDLSTAPVRDSHQSLLQMRLWSRGIALYEGRIHEIPIYDTETIATVSVHEIMLLHKPNFDLVHNNRNTILLDDVIKSGEATARELFYYAETMYVTSNQRKKGWEKLEKGATKIFKELITDPNLGAAIYKVYCYLADSEINSVLLGNEADFSQANEYIMNALMVSQLYPEPYYLMGKVLYISNRSRYSIGWFKQAIEMPTTISVWHSSKNFKRSLPAENLAFVYLELGDQERAIRYHVLARAMDRKMEENDHKFNI